MKSLDQIEPRTPISSLPFTISASGSYYLTKNLTGVAGQQGITISADDVSLDLNGFSLVGVVGSLHGIVLPVVKNNLLVRNGTVRNWGANGIQATGASNGQFERLLLFGNTQSGMSVGEGNNVTDCSARSNLEVGIATGQNSTISRCTVISNGSTGINGRAASVVSQCTAQSNAGNGIQVGQDGMISDCTVRGSTVTAGIVGGTGSLVKNSTSSSNAGTAKGIVVGAYSSVIGCIAANNPSIGIEAGDHSVVKDSAARSNGGAQGIVAPKGTLANCSAAENDGTGLSAGTVTGCTANSNGATGIVADNVANSSANSNDGGGVWAFQLASNCSAENNAGTGIRGGRAVDCHANTSGSAGFDVGTAQNCTATASGTTGIDASAAALDCTASSNIGIGIVTPTATGCKSNSNGSHGIHVSKLAQNNECTGNGTTAANGAGIFFDADRVRIDNNHCTANDWGIKASGPVARCLVIRNMCIGNAAAPTSGGTTGNFDFSLTSVVHGPILLFPANLPLSTTGPQSQPWANFELEN